MKTIHLSFAFDSYWQAASGRGNDELLDSTVARGAGGLPVLPGRTIKGLLREAYRRAVACGALQHDREIELFGSEVAGADQASLNDADQAKALDEGRFRTKAGALAFGTATLPQAWIDWASTDPSARAVVDELFTQVSSTAINERDGVALDHTLRVVEVAVPMTLTAAVDGPDDADWVEQLRDVAPLLRALGARRNRGYGRVAVTVEEGR